MYSYCFFRHLLWSCFAVWNSLQSSFFRTCDRVDGPSWCISSGSRRDRTRRRYTLSQSCNVVNSWEDVPLEFSRLSVDSIIISVAFLGSDSCNPVLPSFVGFWDVEEPFPRHNKESENTQTFVRWRLMSISSPISDRRFQEFFPHKFCLGHWFLLIVHTNCAVTSNICFKVRLSWFFTTLWTVEKFFPMNVAAFNVVAMNIPHITECSSPDSATFDILFCLFRTWSLTLSTNYAASLPMTTFFGICLFLVMHWHKFPRFIVNELSVPCSMRISCREEIPHDEGQLFAMYPEKFPQVSPIDRAPHLHFSTLEKTKIDHNPRVCNLIVTVAQVSAFYRNLQQIFQDLDTRSYSSWVVIWLWHVLLLLVELVLPSQRCKL